MAISLQLSLRYSDFELRVDTQLPAQGVIGIFGRSGSGKTSLLRCVAGLEKPTGQIIVNGEPWQDDKQFLLPHKRPVAYVFQEASLFPHLSVQGNLDFALKRAAPGKPVITFYDALELFNISALLPRRIDRLSGGEKQRVAMVRALLINPQLLLMDEPLAALDINHKGEILSYLENLHRDLNIPIIYVSHSIEEIIRLADHLLILEKGKLIAEGPIHATLARIDLPVGLGDDTSVIVDATIVERDSQWHLLKLNFSGGSLWLPDNGGEIGQTIRIRILARDVSLTLSQHEDSSILNRLATEVAVVKDDPATGMALLQLKAGDDVLLARVTQRSLQHLQLQTGSRVWAQIKSVAVAR